MKQSIQIAHLVNGEVLSVRRLSARAERRTAWAAAAVVLGMTALAAGVVAGGLSLADRTIYGPAYLAVWGAVALLGTTAAARRARERARRYAIGVDLQDDAFAAVSMALVRRTPAGYELALAPGMGGVLEGGRTPTAIESLVKTGRARVPLASGTHAQVTLGATTFVVTVLPSDEAPVPLARGFARAVAQRAWLPLHVAALVTVLRAVRDGAPLRESDMTSAIPADATPWEVEKLLRAEAQSQAVTLHACFDELPLACQHPGYVGVGLSLSRTGEIRGQWIARSTYGQDCPVDACMSHVVSGWFFEPLPESMRIVLPVQVLRTTKPLPAHAALGDAPRASPPVTLARNGVN